METILFEPLMYNGRERVALRYRNNQLERVIRKIKDIRWLAQHECWHFPLSKEACREAYVLLSPLATIDLGILKEYLEKRKKIALVQVIAGKSGVLKPKVLSTYLISDANLAELTKMMQALHLKAYSANTLSLYKSEMQVLMRLLREVPFKELTPEHVRSYILWLLQNRKYSEFQVHTAINALKFYFEQVLHRPKMFVDIPRPKKPQQLPTVYAGSEVSRLFASKDNCKHKTMLMTAYAAGLRISEIVALKIGDIDSARMVINVRQAKGKKDRQVVLSLVLLDQLRLYYKEYKPKDFLFEGVNGGAYSVRSLQEVFHSEKSKAGIKKQGGVHELRHSFATHLMEQGTEFVLSRS